MGLSIDVVYRVLAKVLLSPFFVWLIPVTLGIGNYSTRDTGYILSQTYAILVVVFQILSQISKIRNGGQLDFENDVAVITGGSAGLGAVMASLLSKRLASVVVVDVAPPRARIAGVQFFQCDVSDREAVAATFAEIAEKVGPVTILVNNAGVSKKGTIVDAPLADIEQTIAVNLTSHFYTAKAVLPKMMELNRGYVVSVSSSLAYQGPIEYAAYGASKAGVLGLHESLTYELLDYTGIKTLLVTPGQMYTSMFDEIQSPLEFWAPKLKPIDLAREVIDTIDVGGTGQIALPLYVNYMPFVRALPPNAVRFFRWLSGMDAAVRNARVAA
ncbi:uncharacterized protein V1510DRAFT_408833 [Dipodascopsis tothii]|uniref:uncharacterized protein n=1 Tax=Dipodascopsis tothii TaxID=44089 RepID=UPI0034CD52C3